MLRPQMAEESSFARLMESASAQATGRATRRLRAGDVVEVTVIQISHDSVFVDVGLPSDGRIARAELQNDDGSVRVRVGDRLRATVLDPRPDAPQLAVSLGHGSLDTSSLELAKMSGAPVEGEVSKVNKGGLEVQLGTFRAFCPASQVELNHVADLNVYVGQKLEFKVIEVRDNGRSIVVSRRALLEDRRREAQLSAKERLAPGSEVEGTIASVNKHGAVVDLDGVEGFIHLSELAGHRVQRAEDVVRIGERVRLRVLSVDDSPKGLKVRLSLKALAAPEPGKTAAPPQEQVLVGTVTRLLQHGILVETAQGEGLLPLRELGLAPGADHRRAYPPGKQLSVVVVSRAGGKLTFSATQVARVEERQNYREFSNQGASGGGASLGSLGDLFKGKLPAVAPPKPEPAKAEPRAAKSFTDIALKKKPRA
ncbi:MAG TPA: S1 RNA-binding domain-containing protein [Polyangiaceae bacterium]|nr:S1 RNA-binding domain-containing protein [Polyangiaceae bacterium]